MTSSLFQEALADAKQLKEVAEQNAKNAIIDSVTPKIRKFIEEQLLEGAARAEQAIDDDEPALSEIDLASDGMDPVDTVGDEDALQEQLGLLRTMSKIAESLTPEESASLIPLVEKMRIASQKSGSPGIIRGTPSDVRSTHIVKENAAMQGKNKMYEVDLDELMSDEISAEEEGMHMGHMEGMDMEDEAMDMDEEMAEDEMSDLYESLSALLEEKEDDDAPLSAEGEEEGEEEEEEEGMDAGGADATSEVSPGMDAVVEKVDNLEAMVAKILDMLSSGAAAGGEAPEAAAPAPEAMPEPAPAEGEMPPGAAPSPSERVYRVNESALMRELKRLREGKDMHGEESVDEAAEDEAAEDEGMDLAEMMGKMKNGKATDEGRGVKAGKMPAHTKSGAKAGKADAGVSAPYTEAAKVMKENRDLKVSLEKHAEAINSLRGQLTEMNLFNAKLLYVNRLLQNRDLTDAQRRNIVESLDRAQSLREVKLLYKGLSESIGRKPVAKGKAELVSESVGSRAVSPTSRPLSTSGVRLNEAVEVHRWSVLAGISSKS